MNSLQDRIISVFIDKQTRILKNTEVSDELVEQGIPCNAEDVRRLTQSLSPALFQLISNDDRTTTIRVEPKIEICEAFLESRCKIEGKSCEKLHICRHIEGHCPSPSCHFPHDFTRGNNQKIVVEHQCQHINPVLLVKLLRINKFPLRPPPTENNRNVRGGFGGHRGGPDRNPGGPVRHRDGPVRKRTDPYVQRRRPRRSVATEPHLRVDSVQRYDLDRQVDVSFPSSNLAKQIDMEIIGMRLRLCDINVEDKVKEKEDEYYRRGTMQLERINDVEKLLMSPIIDHHGISIKFKRTKRTIDKTTFILKTSINNEHDKIHSHRFELYVAILVGKDLMDSISDLSSDSEQIMLVQCKGEIDFVKAREANKFKPKLFDKDITLTQIYECCALEIHYNDNTPMTENDLRKIFQPVWTDIFAYSFTPENDAEVEFINADAFKKWMLKCETIQKKFNITINRIIDSVEEHNDDTRSNVSIGDVSGPCQTKIQLSPDWALIAAHPKFKFEYKEFIRNEFGGEINVNEDEATYIGTFPRHARGSSNEIILQNKTAEFMRRFDCKTFNKLERNHIDILKANSSTVAFSRIKGNDYIVATKLNEMKEFKRKLFAETNPLPQPYSTINPQPKQSYPIINPPSSPKPYIPPVTSAATTTSTRLINNPEQMSMFSIDTFEDRLLQYLQETFNVKAICERPKNAKAKGVKSSIGIKITGQMNDVQNAIRDLENLFSLLRTKKFDDKTDGNWTKIAEATQVIQHHFNRADLICTCQLISPTNVHVYYFDITNPQFGVDEQKIEDLIKDQFQTATIIFNQQSMSSKLSKDCTDLEEQIRKRDDYKKDICLYKESNMIYLFGLPNLVKEFRLKFEQLKSKNDPQPCQFTLSERQLNYLTHVAKADMNKLEKQYKSDGCDISLARLRHNCEFIAPPDLHSTIKEHLEALAQIYETSFDVDEPGFETLVNKEPERLLTLVKSKCFLEKKIETYHDNIPIPKARVGDLEDGIKQPLTTTATASASPNITNVTIASSTVSISFGTLTAQAVDAIVLSSSSNILCEQIVNSAGPQVRQEYAAIKSSGNFPNTTSGGTLSCKRIIFVPWSPISREEADVKSSLNSFISIAFKYALEQECKSIAFPAVGCGQLNYNPSIIAKYMLQETKNQLKICKIKMNISFILVENQQNVYDTFIKCLNDMESIDLAVSSKILTTKKDDRSTIPYDRKIVKITLISSNDKHLIKCKEDILNLARSFSTKSQTIKQDMLDWSQNTIYRYYAYCLKQRVIPILDLANTTLELIGAKDAVHDAEKYFYELTSETFKKARIHAVSQGVIWSVELTPNSDRWEQYSYKINGIIEDASLKKHPHVDFENDKEERCQIIFSKMEEQYQTRIRRVRRKLVDSTLPRTWEPSDQNCKRVTLQSTSPEYQNVLAHFHVTMLGKYSQIIKIERIQNERWYKQYVAHRDDFEQRYSKADERLLFHGCQGTSADQIIQGCFNRSFAGVNGVLFGYGVYFHAQASYSHQYAHANSSGERTMFLARVLIGKTCKGDQSMRTAPPGFDTTTDGTHIFVVYHDAGAYAEHLITYK